MALTPDQIPPFNEASTIDLQDIFRGIEDRSIELGIKDAGLNPALLALKLG